MFKTLHSPENQRLISWLKKQRQNQGLSMRELSDRLGVPHSFVGKIEQGERRIDVVEFIQYCEALGVSPVHGLEAIDSNPRF
jgi:transcriptional regulator with XRE-family HTH domain